MGAAQDVKARLDIVEIVSRYVDLKQRGDRWLGLCPFHNEKTASFSVSRSEGYFYCFGCQAAGDVIDFYCRINGVEFKEALTQLAREAGVELTGFSQPDPKRDAERAFAARAREMHDWAAKRFQENLHGPGGQACREYLERRGLSAQTVADFGLGWALPGWQDVEQFLGAKGYKPEEAARAGLLATSERGRTYDRFRERLIFPIKDLSGRVVAFGGRILTGDGPKYINSTDSVIYKKGEHLYGLYQARRSLTTEKRALLTEGYMDVLTLHQFGYTNSCGVLGTALTPEQVKRLAGFASTVELIFDGDEAGRKAALKSAQMLLSAGLNCRVLLMPEGEDVDSLLQSGGREAFEAVLAQAVDGLDYMLGYAARNFSPKELLEWAKGFVVGLDAPDLSAYYIPRLAGGLGLAEPELRSAVARKLNQSQRQGQGLMVQDGPPAGPGNLRAGRVSGHPSGQASGRGGQDTVRDRRERELLHFLIRHPEYLPYVREWGGEKLLATEFGLGLYRAVAAYAEAGDETGYYALSPEQKRFWVEAANSRQALADSAPAEFQALCERLLVDHKVAACREIRAAVRAGRAAGTAEGSPAEDPLEMLKALSNRLKQEE